MDLRTDTHRRKDKRPSATVAALAVSIALLASLVPAASAQAGIYDFRAGVSSTNSVGAPDLTRMREARVKTMRVAFNWNGVEAQRKPAGAPCSGARYSFGRYDAMVAEAGRQGVKLLPVLFGSPEYVQGGDFSNMPRTGTREMSDYICYVRALVDRYGRGGTFPAINGPAQPITEWQMWNEENLPNYAANQQVNAAEYGRFVKETAAAVRANDSAATLVLGGVPERTSRGMNAEPYLRRLYRVNNIRSKFAVVALHPYAENARGVKGALIRMREMLADVGDRRQVIWLTEVGYASHGPKGHFLVNSEQGQAQKLADTMQLVRNTHQRYKVGTVHWYSWRDTEPYTRNSNLWFVYAGLYRVDGSPKPSCNAYARFTGGVRPCRSIPAPTAASASASALEAPTQQIVPSPPPGG